MKKIKETLDYINSITNGFKPEIAVILGSGLGSFCNNLKGYNIPYNDIPHFASSNVKGHKGELLFCKIEEKNCVIMQGRFHFYEGNSMQEATYPIKIFKQLGVNTLIITNAAGAVNKNLDMGDIVLVKDHINFMGTNPLIGKNDDSMGERFPDMSNCYNKNLIEIAKKCAKSLDINLKEGVYLATTGPSYETAAEINAFRILGADVVGMSSVPEAIVANWLKIKTMTLSLVTNFATGVSQNKLSHQEVIETGKKQGQKVSNLIKEIIKNI